MILSGGTLGLLSSDESVVTGAWFVVSTGGEERDGDDSDATAPVVECDCWSAVDVFVVSGTTVGSVAIAIAPGREFKDTLLLSLDEMLLALFDDSTDKPDGDIRPSFVSSSPSAAPCFTSVCSSLCSFH